MRTSLATVTNVDCRLSAAAALTAGTRTLDTNPTAMLSNTALPVGGVLFGSSAQLFSAMTGFYPLVLAQNEGIVIASITAMGAAGVVVLYPSIEFAEALAY